MFPEEEKNKNLKWLLIIVAVFFIAFIILAIGCYGLEMKYQGLICPGVAIGKIDLSGKNKEEAKEIINEKIKTINKDGIKFVFNEGSNTYDTVITPTVSSLEGDLAYEIMLFYPDKTIDKAYAIGRGNNIVSDSFNKIKTLFSKKNIDLEYDINKAEIEKILKDNYEKFEIPAQNARLSTSTDIYSSEIIFDVENERLGKIIDYRTAITELESSLDNLDILPIILKTKSEYPEIYKKDVLNIDAQINEILEKTPFELIYKENKWEIDKNILSNWLGLVMDNKKISVSIDKKLSSDYLINKVASQIDKDPIEPRFEMKNGKVVEFQVNRDGLKLNIEKNIEKMKKEFLKENNKTVELIVDVIKTKSSGENNNNYGIEKIIGVGHSNFSGSPTNRRHNIATGAASVNGTLIEPGEEFSLNQTLGEIEAETGYLPELVIKGNETIPEYGGGLCQIGTTVFRGALDSGLPITMRRNHSYRVSYYEPAGTDATIYDPWPDMRFINDTGNYILIQSRIEGNDLYFEFWGKPDGRIVEKTDPVIYNITKPGPTKLIETLVLQVGEKKCTEHAHNGADAYFDYTVTYPDNEIKEERFSSHYIPWQEVCLIGVEKLSEDEETASSTEQAVSTQQ